MSSFLSNINNGNVPVIAIDVSRDLLRKFIDCNVLEDESFKSKSKYIYATATIIKK